MTPAPTPAAVRLRDPRERVSPRAQQLWCVEYGIEAAVVLAVLLVGGYFWDAVDLSWWLVALLVLLGAGFALGVPVWRYRVHRWEATATAVYTQRGWWARERRIAPMSRIQTVDLAQGVLARVLGLATVTVTTASAAGALRIDGLELDVAQRLVDDLTAAAETAEGDAT